MKPTRICKITLVIELLELVNVVDDAPDMEVNCPLQDKKRKKTGRSSRNEVFLCKTIPCSMSRFLVFSSALLAFLAIASCSSDRQVADVWSFIQERPDSALSVLNTLPASSFKGRTLAEYQLLKAMAMDKNYIDVSSDSLARPAYDYFHKHGPKEKEMMSLYYIAITQYYSSDFQQAIITLDQTLDLAKACNNVRYMGYAHMMKSNVHMYGLNFVDAIHSAEAGITCFSMVPDSTLQVRRAKQQLADSYLANHDMLNACSIYEELLPTAPADTFFQRKGLANYAWALYLLDKNKAQDALDLMNHAIKDYHLQLTPENAQHYAVFLLALGKKEQAISILHVLEQQSSNPELAFYLDYLIQKSEGNYKKALEKYESLLTRQNEIAVKTMQQSLMRGQRDLQEQMRRTAELKTTQTRLTAGMVIILLTVMFLGLLLFTFEKRKRAVRVREELLAGLKESQSMLSNYSKKMEELESGLEEAKNKYIEAYKSQFQRISSMVETYYASSDKKNHRDQVYREVQRLAEGVGNDYARMNHLENSINKTLDNVMVWYREEFPGKDRKHYYLVCYFIAGFPGSMIEALTGIPRSTVYSHKTRLLSKIMASDAPHKELFIKSIK